MTRHRSLAEFCIRWTITGLTAATAVAAMIFAYCALFRGITMDLAPSLIHLARCLLCGVATMLLLRHRADLIDEPG